MKALILLSLFVSSFSWAQGITLPEGVSAAGNVRYKCVGYLSEFSASVTSRIEVSKFGEGKIRIGLFAEKFVKDEGYSHATYTAPFSLHLVGVENGLGAYDLYPADKKNFDKSVGELVLFQKSVSMNLFSDMQVTEGKNSYGTFNCHLQKTGSIKFTVVTPQCFNRRGKEISCPDIRF